MSVASQTFHYGYSPSLRASQSGSVVAIGLRVWRNLLAAYKANRVAAANARAEQELFNLVREYETSMPSFAADLRAASLRRR